MQPLALAVLHLPLKDALVLHVFLPVPNVVVIHYSLNASPVLLPSLVPQLFVYFPSEPVFLVLS